MARANELAGMVVVITGASSGFGRGAALAFAREGAAVVLAARRSELLDALVREIEAGGRTALAVPTDVSVTSDVERLARRAIERFGHVDVWINNAGIGAIGPFERIPLEDHEQVIRTDLLGTLYGSYHAYRHFLQRRGGILINVASELGHYTVPYFSSYAAAKHGVLGLDEALQQELQQQDGLDDVHVCTVLPTAHDTPFFDHAANYSQHQVQAPEPLHDPQGVIDVLLRLAVDPTDSKVVGGDGPVKVLMKNLAPALTKRMAAKQMHKVQMEGPAGAPDSSGALHTPMAAGTEVRGGRKQAD